MVATKTAAAGTFQSRNGEDGIQFSNKSGKIVSYIDANGVLQVEGIGYPDGSYQNSAPASTGTSVDSGTF